MLVSVADRVVITHVISSDSHGRKVTSGMDFLFLFSNGVKRQRQRSRCHSGIVCEATMSANESAHRCWSATIVGGRCDG